VPKFIKRHDLKSTFAKTIDSVRAYNHNPGIVKEWVNLLYSVRQHYNIPPHRLFNMDQKGVLLGQAQAARIIFNSLRKSSESSAFRQEPGSREFVTIIKCVSAAGMLLQPPIIFKAKHYHEKWLDIGGNRANWAYATSDKGWTDAELSLYWLQAFDEQTRPLLSKSNEFRCLALDNHGVSAETT
jgi:hypothetical protein